ncbi:MAG: MlaD family protein [Deltaproteobacteria bacterium]|jgi:phospholipid/cholesterol/gamma-HCH transport system substrate-binding protein|nr:MlaD family protein [Deltaproteobacteria bacterium]
MSKSDDLKLGTANYSTPEKLTGLIIFVVFVLAVFGGLVVGFGRDFFNEYNNYYVVFSDSYGIIPGVKVRFFGFDIGKVTQVEITKNNKIKMNLSILNEYKDSIKGDSLIVVKSPTIIGGEYLEIQGGTFASLPIPNNGQIPAQDTFTVQTVLNALEVEHNLQQFNKLLSDVTAIADFIQSDEGPVKSVAENINILTARVVAGQGSLGAIVSRQEAYDELMATLHELREVSVSLNQSAASLNSDIPMLTAKVDAILKQVELSSRNFPTITRDTREGLRDVHQVLDSIKNNFLIRGNLPAATPPGALNRPLRGN